MERKIFFENSKGNKLCGILSSSNKNKPIIILCHGLSSSKNTRTNKGLEKVFNKKGISTFRFDFWIYFKRMLISPKGFSCIKLIFS
jgi:alpha/beta superfamily hydrolase